MDRISAKIVARVAFALLLGASARAQNRLQPVPIQQVAIHDDFWSPKYKVWREVTIPDCFAKFEKDGALINFDMIRDGVTGEHHGPPWYDGLIYEMIRGAADFLAEQPDAVLESRLDGYIDRIAAAAAKDTNGYLNTYTQMKEPSHRFGMNGGNDVWQHDCYNAGALIDAGVHYYRATGKTRLLEVGVKLANYMTETIGPAPRANVIPGHALGEEALVNLYWLFKEQPQLKTKLAMLVNEQRYLELAEFWIEDRGHHEGRRDFLAYAQDDQPLLERKTIDGHAVRATLLCAGLAAAANANGRPDYLAASQRLWDDTMERRMYVTGGLGSVAGDEAFAADYVLPNTGYLETCAAVAGAFFDENMALTFADARYADEVEREIFNGALVGVSLKGDAYFYENPLEVDDKHERWAWHGCPCCPPMFLKLMGALPGYIYAQEKGAVYVNQFIGGTAKITVDGTPVRISQSTQYPWNGEINFAVEPEKPAKFAIYLRLPAWCRESKLAVNGTRVTDPEKVHGYVRVERPWKSGDSIKLSLAMPVQLTQADPRVQADSGRIALQRGPIVYCIEGIDAGASLESLAISLTSPQSTEFHPQMLGGVTVIQGKVCRTDQKDRLYQAAWSSAEQNFTAIPYYANANRQTGQMRVWFPLAATPSAK